MNNLYKTSLLIISLGVILSACSKKTDEVVYIPVYANNQACISNYLHKVNFLKADEEMQLKHFPFEIKVPNPVIALLEMKSNSGKDLELLYNGIYTFCFPDTVSVKMSSTDDKWLELADDIKSISDGSVSYFDTKSPVYVEVDLVNKKYSLFQSRANKFNSER